GPRALKNHNELFIDLAVLRHALARGDLADVAIADALVRKTQKSSASTARLPLTQLDRAGVVDVRPAQDRNPLLLDPAVICVELVPHVRDVGVLQVLFDDLTLCHDSTSKKPLWY